jgi:hypothetical protein
MPTSTVTHSKFLSLSVSVSVETYIRKDGVDVKRG